MFSLCRLQAVRVLDQQEPVLYLTLLVFILILCLLCDKFVKLNPLQVLAQVSRCHWGGCGSWEKKKQLRKKKHKSVLNNHLDGRSDFICLYWQIEIWQETGWEAGPGLEPWSTAARTHAVSWAKQRPPFSHVTSKSPLIFWLNTPAVKLINRSQDKSTLNPKRSQYCLSSAPDGEHLRIRTESDETPGVQVSVETPSEVCLLEI